MKYENFKKCIAGILRKSFTNKIILDKFSESTEGKPLYNGELLVDEVTNNYHTTVYVPAQSYSSEEQVIGKWIDGKPIYRRMITVNSISTSGNNMVDIENANIDCPIRLFGSCIFTTSNKRILLNYGVTKNLASADIQLYYNSENQILIGCNDPTKYTNFIILTEYTKSTDEENSFTADMLDKESYTEEEMNSLIDQSVTDIWTESDGTENTEDSGII